MAIGDIELGHGRAFLCEHIGQLSEVILVQIQALPNLISRDCPKSFPDPLFLTEHGSFIRSNSAFESDSVSLQHLVAFLKFYLNMDNGKNAVAASPHVATYPGGAAVVVLTVELAGWF